MNQDQQISLAKPLSGLVHAGAIATSLGTALAFLAVFLLRGGLGDSAAAIAMLYLLAIAPVWLSAWTLSNAGQTPLGGAFAAMSGVMLGMLMPALGLIAAPAAPGFALAGLLLGLWSARRALAQAWSVRGGLVWAAILSGLLLVLLTAPMRLFMQEALLLGAANSDNYLHAANMRMLAHYGHIAIGADGFGYQNYHWLFHILVVGAAKATQADVTLVYGYWTGLVLKLQLAWALFAAGIVLYPPENERGAVGRLAYAWLAMLLAGGFEMESYLLGAALFVAWIPLLLALLRSPFQLAGLAALILGAFLCAAAKASAGYYCAIGLFLLAWHCRARPGVAIAIFVSLAGLAAFANAVLIPKDLLLGAAGLSTLAVSYLVYVGRGILLHYLLPPLLALVFAWKPRGTWRAKSLVFEATAPAPAGDTTALPKWLAGGTGMLKPLRWLARTDDRAQLLLLCLLGTLLVLLTMPIGDNVWDFSVILFMLSLLMLPAALGMTLNARFSAPLVKGLLALAVTAETALACAHFAFDPQTSLKQTLLALYRSASGTADGESTGAARDIIQSWKQTHKPLSHLAALIESSPVSRLKRDLDLRNRAAGEQLAVQVTPAAGDVWHYFEKNDGAKWCLYPHLLVPATAGIVEIRSIPSAALQQACMIPGVVWYGYGKHQDLHRTGDFTPAQLCAMGKDIGMRQIYRLESLRDLSRNRVIECRYAPS